MILLLFSLFVCVMLCLTLIFIRTCLLVATVQFSSMSPTLQHGDRVLALRHLPRRWLRKEQIVLIWPVPGVRFPVPASYKEPPYIKRIVAVSGETYTLALERKLQSWLPPDHPRMWDIPGKHVFVCGDNPAGSVDSTVWGPVPFRNILAVVLIKLPRKDEPAHVPHISRQLANNLSADLSRDSDQVRREERFSR